jgi:hypothetical protein
VTYLERVPTLAVTTLESTSGNETIFCTCPYNNDITNHTQKSLSRSGLRLVTLYFLYTTTATRHLITTCSGTKHRDHLRRLPNQLHDQLCDSAFGARSAKSMMPRRSKKVPQSGQCIPCGRACKPCQLTNRVARGEKTYGALQAG